MTASASVRRPGGWAWDLLLALGVLAAIPNLLVTFSSAAWLSAPAHRAVEDGVETPAATVTELWLYHSPLIVALLALVGMIVFRATGCRRTAGALAILELLGLVLLMATTGLFIL